MSTVAVTCTRCARKLTRKSAVHTRVGILCRHHADRLAPYLRRPPKPTKKASA